jgi:RNA polymerase sigma factor (sigma-70 family)
MTVDGPRSRAVGELVEAAAAGERAAWDELVRRYAALVWAVARTHRLGPADAADVSQTVWLRLVESLGDLREPDALPGWLRTTTRNECLRVIRRGGREINQAEPLTGVWSSDCPSPELLLLESERDRQLWSALRQLSRRCQDLLRVLAYAPEAGYAEISRLLGVPVGSIGPSRARCLAHLRRRLDQTDLPTSPTSPTSPTKATTT